jgi:hypothetical protein
MRLLTQPLRRSHRWIHLKSILNRIERHKCYVYTRIRFVDGLVEPELEVAVERVPWGDGKEHLTDKLPLVPEG